MPAKSSSKSKNINPDHIEALLKELASCFQELERIVTEAPEA